MEEQTPIVPEFTRVQIRLPQSTGIRLALTGTKQLEQSTKLVRIVTTRQYQAHSQ